jgi:hypothetical protein
MTTTISAVFDGSVLHPDYPLSLKPNTRVKLTIEQNVTENEPQSFLKTARMLNLDTPPDFSANLHDYLYPLDKDE